MYLDTLIRMGASLMIALFIVLGLLLSMEVIGQLRGRRDIRSKKRIGLNVVLVILYWTVTSFVISVVLQAMGIGSA